MTRAEIVRYRDAILEARTLEELEAVRNELVARFPDDPAAGELCGAVAMIRGAYRTLEEAEGREGAS